MLTLEEYNVACKPSERRQAFRLRVLFAVLLVFIASIVPALLLFESSGDYAIWYAEKIGGHISALLLILAASVLLGLLLGGLMWIMERADRRDPRLQCPHCHRRLAPIVALSGRCSRCGLLAVTGSWIAQPEHPELPTVAEFKSAIWTFNKSLLIRIGCVFGATFLYMGVLACVMAIAGDRLVAWMAPRWDEREARSILSFSLLPALVILFGGMLLQIRRQQKRPRDRRLTCPHCSGKLEEQHHVVVTRRCAKCESFVLKDPDADPGRDAAHARLLNLDAFRASASTYAAVTNALLLAYLIGFAAVGWALIAREKALKERFGKGEADAFFIGLIVLAFVAIGALVGIADKFFRRWLRQDCPHCRKSVGYPRSTAMATHRCPHCGKRIFAELDAQAAEQPVA